MYNVHRIQVMRKNLPKIYEASKFNSQMHVIIITLLKGSSPKYAQQNIIYKVESKTWKKDSNCFADKSYLQQKSADRLSAVWEVDRKKEKSGQCCRLSLLLRKSCFYCDYFVARRFLFFAQCHHMSSDVLFWLLCYHFPLFTHFSSILEVK